MCTSCGCGPVEARISGDPHAHAYPHAPAPAHDRAGRLDESDADQTSAVDLGGAVLERNDRVAELNRRWLTERGVRAVNLMSSTGAGKTTVLEQTIARSRCPVSVIGGDQETTFDAERIGDAGARAVQVNTGAGCHLDAEMVRRALDLLHPTPGELLFIENVGNLVCPALFDLGEMRRVVVVSVTDGDDKPLKYPHIFAAADLVLVNKIDLLPYVDFDVERLARDVHQLNPDLELLLVSARTGENFDRWDDWVSQL